MIAMIGLGLPADYRHVFVGEDSNTTYYLGQKILPRSSLWRTSSCYTGRFSQPISRHRNKREDGWRDIHTGTMWTCMPNPVGMGKFCGHPESSEAPLKSLLEILRLILRTCSVASDIRSAVGAAGETTRLHATWARRSGYWCWWATKIGRLVFGFFFNSRCQKS